MIIYHAVQCDLMFESNWSVASVLWQMSSEFQIVSSPRLVELGVFSGFVFPDPGSCMFESVIYVYIYEYKDV